MKFLSDLKADDRISVLGEDGVETRGLRCVKDGFVWTRKPNSSAVFYKSLPPNVVTVDPDRSQIQRADRLQTVSSTD